MFCILGSDIFRGSVYGKGHPLNIARVWPVIDICLALGWIERGSIALSPRPGPKPCSFSYSRLYSGTAGSRKISKLGDRKCSVTELGWIIIRYFRKSIAVRQPPQRPAFMGQTYCCQATGKLFLTRQGVPSRDAGQGKWLLFCQ